MACECTQVHDLAESMRIAGEVGSAALPKDVKMSKITVTDGGPTYTVIGNAAAIKLADSVKA